MGRTTKSSKKRSGKSRPKGGKHSSKKRSVVVPGYTRQVGAYGRAMPCGPEKKYRDSIQAGSNMLGGGGTWTLATPPVAVPTAAAPAGTNGCHFTLIPQNTTDVTRIGNKICVTNFNFKGQIVMNTLASALAVRVRYMFVWDLQANGATALPSDLLKDYAGAATIAVNEFRNLDQVERFKAFTKGKWKMESLARELGAAIEEGRGGATRWFVKTEHDGIAGYRPKKKSLQDRFFVRRCPMGWCVDDLKTDDSAGERSLEEIAIWIEQVSGEGIEP